MSINKLKISSSKNTGSTFKRHASPKTCGGTSVNTPIVPSSTSSRIILSQLRKSPVTTVTSKKIPSKSSKEISLENKEEDWLSNSAIFPIDDADSEVQSIYEKGEFNIDDFAKNSLMDLVESQKNRLNDSKISSKQNNTAFIEINKTNAYDDEITNISDHKIIESCKKSEDIVVNELYDLKLNDDAIQDNEGNDLKEIEIMIPDHNKHLSVEIDDSNLDLLYSNSEDKNDSFYGEKVVDYLDAFEEINNTVEKDELSTSYEDLSLSSSNTNLSTSRPIPMFSSNSSVSNSQETQNSQAYNQANSNSNLLSKSIGSFFSISSSQSNLPRSSSKELPSPSKQKSSPSMAIQSPTNFRKTPVKKLVVTNSKNDTKKGIIKKRRNSFGNHSGNESYDDDNYDRDIELDLLPTLPSKYSPNEMYDTRNGARHPHDKMFYNRPDIYHTGSPLHAPPNLFQKNEGCTNSRPSSRAGNTPYFDARDSEKSSTRNKVLKVPSRILKPSNHRSNNENNSNIEQQYSMLDLFINRNLLESRKIITGDEKEMITQFLSVSESSAFDDCSIGSSLTSHSSNSTFSSRIPYQDYPVSPKHR